MDHPASSPENTDYDDSFEDAQDTAVIVTAKHEKTNSRSLTGTPQLVAIDRTSKISASPIEYVKEAQLNHDASSEEAVDLTQDADESQSPPAKSPLLTAHRMSTASMDDVNISALKPEDAAEPVALERANTTSEVLTVQQNSPPQKPTSRFAGFTGSFRSIPWGAQQPASAKSTESVKSSNNKSASPPPSMYNSRKITAPFSWLGRGSISTVGKSPPLPATRARRNTAASISTIGSNPELMLKTLDSMPGDSPIDPSRPPARTTLRDRFKMLRMREEAGIDSLETEEAAEGGAIAGLVGRTTSIGLGIASPHSMEDEKDNPLSDTVPPVAPPQQELKRTLTTPPEPASNSTGPAREPATPIDWDFWQSVVNEGPQAVAKSSPEELTQALVGGIPQTIRGVIWQVLSGSKNEDLESVYKDLITRGTDKEIKAPTPIIPQVVNSGPGSPKKSVSIASSRSSIRSLSSRRMSVSTPPTSRTPSQDAEDASKLHARLDAERKQKAKEEAAALQKLEKMIRRDMGARTSFTRYTAAAGLQDSLFNVCKAYALFDEAVGYPQGLNFIVMPLLLNMPEEEAFCLLVRLMNKYGLREMFVQDMPGLHLHLYQFERLLEDLEPALYCHLNRRGVTPKVYATQWFLTLFAYRFPLQLVMRVFDLMLSEGLGAILKFGLAVMQKNVDTLLGMNDMLALNNFLKEKLFDAYVDQAPTSKSILESGFFGNSGNQDDTVYRADILVQDAASVALTPDMLARYKFEWDEKVRAEKERDLELENFRTTVTSQTARIKQLEQRTQKSDTEHVQIASELVRIKVENEELLDHNESLKGQVEELKKVADLEAANVEERLRAEMDRVMTRNQEVQNENRRMEDSMASMEKSLVETKMAYAEINENYESLKQKWNDLRKALD